MRDVAAQRPQPVPDEPVFHHFDHYFQAQFVTQAFAPSLKLEVVRMIKEQGQSIQNVSESMGIGQSAIRRWPTQYGAEQSGQPGIGKPLTAEQQRIRQLEAENLQLRQDVTILKKASAFFAREMK